MKGSMGTSSGIVTLRNPKNANKRKKTSFKMREDGSCKLCKDPILKGATAYGSKAAPFHSACNRKFKAWLRSG